VQQNVQKWKQQETPGSGQIIYSLLESIFLSLESDTFNRAVSKINMPEVYRLPYDVLQDSTGRIVIQQFFYGDKDGAREYQKFLAAYRNPNWITRSKEYWVETESVKGKYVIIYSNKPLDEDTYQDVKAQEALAKYLQRHRVTPSIMIHRGHSYFVKYSIPHVTPQTKLVFLGSCGGFNNLNDVIHASPGVHIIATKQVGSGGINQPVIVYLTDLLRKGKDLDWPLVWMNLALKFKSNPLFDDYIPPYKNLGAIFMMAYQEALNDTPHNQ
jgi:hypothetical protein